MPRPYIRWVEAIRKEAEKVFPEPGTGPVHLFLFFILPKGHPADLDNLVKAPLDALIGVAYMDDGQVEFIQAHRKYSQMIPGSLTAFVRFPDEADQEDPDDRG